MTILQADIPIGASDKIIAEWGAPGAIIIIILVGVLIFGRWFAKREKDRQEYDKIIRTKQDEKFDNLQKKYEDQIGTIAVTNEKLVDMSAELKDVVINNTVTMQGMTNHFVESNKYMQEFIKYLQELNKK